MEYFVCCSVLPIAMDRAIKEIVSGIVQRSVTIATHTTKELVMKVCSIQFGNHSSAIVLMQMLFSS